MVPSGSRWRRWRETSASQIGRGSSDASATRRRWPARAGDLLVLPATHRSEAFGLVQVEAMACGLPVISTNIDSGVPFVNQDGVTGLIVEPADPMGLAGAMRRLLSDEGLRLSLGRAARQRVEDLFSRDVMVRDNLALYRELLDSPSGNASRAGERVTP